MGMHRLFASAAIALGISLAPSAAHAEFGDRPVITTTQQGTDLTVVVHAVTDYCSTNASTDVVRRGDSIRIVRDRPTVVSRCMSQRDLTFVVHDVKPGTYGLSYEQVPYVAPARYLILASTTVNVRG